MTAKMSKPRNAKLHNRRGSDAVAKRSAKRANSLTMLDAVVDLIGSVDGLPSDLSANTKIYLKSTGN